MCDVVICTLQVMVWGKYKVYGVNPESYKSNGDSANFWWAYLWKTKLFNFIGKANLAWTLFVFSLPAVLWVGLWLAILSCKQYPL